MKKLLTGTLALLFITSCGKIERPNDILNDITGSTRDVEAYDKHKEKISELEDQVTGLRGDISNLNINSSMVEELLKQQLNDAALRVETLLADNSYLKTVRASLFDRITILNSELNTLQATNEDLKEINAAIIKTNGYLTNRVYYLYRYNQALLSAYVRKWYEIRCLQNLLIEKNERIVELQEQVKSLTNVVESYRKNSIVVYLVNLLNSGVTELHIKFENGSIVKLKNKDGQPIISPVDDVVSNNSLVD